MKTKFSLLLVLVYLSGCSLLSSPTGTAKKFISSAEKGDAEAMTGLFSSKAKEKTGLQEIRANNRQFVVRLGQIIAEGAKFKVGEIKETLAGDGAHVSLLYEDTEGNNSVRIEFDLSKENGTWKIDHLGPGDSKAIGGTGVGSAPAVSPAPGVEPPPPPVSSQYGTTTASPTAMPAVNKPISGGVLNGKAISLPQPPYPPIARAAKVSGAVVVQVVVDESGNVTNAQAVSGHPLLRAACVAAARSAKFTPTKLSGQPVKVSGVINYNFAPQ